ncbi:MAG: MotA/TolQ/ExbB proton channel family protein [Candidatus Margulisbacteria bacterium]|nr:MotA/TolQ/ExbB proton channel family protein [Candidatus Margulisiibacteriota bacterium]
MEINFILAFGFVLIFVLVGSPDMLINPSTYIHIPSLALVLAGSMIALLMSSKFVNFKSFLIAAKLVLFPPKKPPQKEIINELISYSKVVTSSGKKALIAEVEKTKDPFIRRGLELIINRLGFDFIKAALDNDIEEMQKRHSDTIKMFKNMSQFTPVFGMVGTIVGLMQVLRSMQDPTKIGPAMALALVTTFYGAMFSGLIFLPFSQKLKVMSDEEVLIKRLITEGILLIEKEEIPTKVEKYLETFLHSQAKIKNKKDKPNG